MAQKKLPPADQLLIVREIRDLLLKGYRTRDIYVFTAKKYEISKPQTDRYLKKAKDDFKQVDTKTKGQLRAKYRERLEMLYNEALMVKKDMRLALEFQKELNKLISDPDGEMQVPDIKVVFNLDEPGESGEGTDDTES